ncbi:hypothetical protein BWI93_13190 [Siphonobacter sp. BAB-5385]|uniref:HTTM domain-containing protein n=2 Tax=unclassified Siphonobacter TaxID=2635712 RepID=UPI000B9ECDCF|nr:hypothetical protein BWI93_13190 [Siphonobacter sp. BAB-5385]
MEKTLPLSINQTIYKHFFIARKEDRDFLYYFRMAIGIFCLLHFASYLSDFESIYVNNSIVPQDIMDIQRPWFVPNIASTLDYISSSLHLSKELLLHTFLGYYMLLCVCLATGLFSRFTAINLLILHLVIVKGSSVYSYGVDYFTSIALFYCVIFPVGHSKSLDRLLFNYESVNPSPYRKILQLHLCIVYFASGVEKIIGDNWRNGESIWKSLHLPGFTSAVSMDYEFLSTLPMLALIIGWSVVLIELLYPLFIWKQPYRNIGLLLVCSMHLGILLCLGLYYFSSLMIILNLTAFLDLSPNDNRK